MESRFDQEDPDEDVEWTAHSMLYDFKGRHANGEPIEYRVGIFGTTIFYQSSVIDGRWFGFLAPFGMPRPGQTKTYMILAARKSDGDDRLDRSVFAVRARSGGQSCERRCACA